MMNATIKMLHLVDPKTEITEKIGDLSKIELFGPEVLVATYVRPEKTAGGIIQTSKTRDEDNWQGKVGLVLKTGSDAFFGDGRDLKVGDWVFYRPSDGFDMQVNGVRCRLLKDNSIRGRLPNPDILW